MHCSLTCLIEIPHGKILIFFSPDNAESVYAFVDLEISSSSSQLASIGSRCAFIIRPNACWCYGIMRCTLTYCCPKMGPPSTLSLMCKSLQVPRAVFGPVGSIDRPRFSLRRQAPGRVVLVERPDLARFSRPRPKVRLSSRPRRRLKLVLLPRSPRSVVTLTLPSVRMLLPPSEPSASPVGRRVHGPPIKRRALGVKFLSFPDVCRVNTMMPGANRFQVRCRKPSVRRRARTCKVVRPRLTGRLCALPSGAPARTDLSRKLPLTLCLSVSCALTAAYAQVRRSTATFGISITGRPTTA